MNKPLFTPFPLEDANHGFAERSAAFADVETAACPSTHPRTRAAAAGPAALTDGELLMTVLEARHGDLASSYAALLLRELGSIQAVLCADKASLQRLVGVESALDLAIAGELNMRAARASIVDRCLLTSYSAVVAYLRATLAGRPREAFTVLFMNKKNRLIADEIMGHGTIDFAPVFPREIVRRALELNAASLVISHQHPSDETTPSRGDIEMTKRIDEAVKPLGISLHDHIVIGVSTEVSFRAKGLLP